MKEKRGHRTDKEGRKEIGRREVKEMIETRGERVYDSDCGKERRGERREWRRDKESGKSEEGGREKEEEERKRRKRDAMGGTV